VFTDSPDHKRSLAAAKAEVVRKSAASTSFATAAFSDTFRRLGRNSQAATLTFSTWPVIHIIADLQAMEQFPILN
jgi:hypothetical protein